MNARFGNLTISGFETKTEVQFSEEDRKWMEEHRIDKADFKDDDKFHIFELPLGIMAGSNIGEELINRLKKYSEYKRHFYVETKESGD